jgi:hypothetical protein
MIRITTLSGTDLHSPEDPAIRIWVTGRSDILKLQALLNRALGCAPEFGADWFKLSDDLDKFIGEQNLTPTKDSK